MSLHLPQATERFEFQLCVSSAGTFILFTRSQGGNIGMLKILALMGHQTKSTWQSRPGGSVGWNLITYTKRQWAQSSVGAHRETTDCFLSLSPFLFSKININKLILREDQKRIPHGRVLFPLHTFNSLNHRAQLL